MEDIAGETLRVHPHQHVVLAADIALHQSDVLAAIDGVGVGEHSERAELGRQLSLRHPLNQPLGLQAVGDDLGDGHEPDAVPLGEGLQLRAPSHGAVGVQDLANHARRRQPRHSGQVDGRLGLADPLQHAARLRPQREDMAGPSQVFGLCGGIDRHPDRPGPVRRADPRRYPMPRHSVDRHHEGGALRIAHLVSDRGEHELLHPLRRERQADETTAVSGHEVDDLRRHLFGGANQIALVLPIFIVGDDDDLAAANRCYRVLHRIELYLAHFYLRVSPAGDSRPTPPSPPFSLSPTPTAVPGGLAAFSPRRPGRSSAPRTCRSCQPRG